jgi:hypothetical protein
MTSLPIRKRTFFSHSTLTGRGKIRIVAIHEKARK